VHLVERVEHDKRGVGVGQQSVDGPVARHPRRGKTVQHEIAEKQVWPYRRAPGRQLFDVQLLKVDLQNGVFWDRLAHDVPLEKRLAHSGGAGHVRHHPHRMFALSIAIRFLGGG
jgi:hypothetical protein